MVLKSDDHPGDFCQKTDASEDSNSTVLASERRRGRKGLRQGKDGSSVNRRSNGGNEVFCSGAGKDNRNKSCVPRVRNNLGEGTEEVDSKTDLGNLGLGYDTEDGHPEFMKHSLLSEVTTQKSSLSSNYNCSDQIENVMGSKEVSESNEKCEHPLQTSLGDDVDESDIMEEDVKVCDTCGDAGREDLLAVCNRCSDGAEHTYCMREMLDKVPEGDWLCEECKYNEALETRRLEHLKLLETERSKSLGRTNSVNSDVSSKLDRKDSFSERCKPKTVSLSKQLSLQRSGDNIEAVPTAKKQFIESITSSPTALSLSRVPVLSKDSSIKNSDKTKGKPTNQFSTDADSGGDSSENTRSPTINLKGNIVKSNSFISSVENIKGSEEVVQKQKLVDVKEGPGKLIGKSMSFKSLGRSSAGESKVKMLSPKCAPVQELKGQKQIRDRNSFERKNSIKLDSSISVQTMANTKRLSHSDNISTSFVSKSRDYRVAQSDGKLTCLSGEVKRLSSTNIRGLGTSISAEAKPSHVSSNDGSTFISSRAVDGSYGGANGTKSNLHDTPSEKAQENALSRSRQGANASLVGGNRRGFSLDASTLKGKDGVHEENKLKAAIEAAMQRKQDIFKKNKVPDKLSELSMSNSQTNVGPAASNQVADLISEETVHGRDTIFSNRTMNSCKNISIDTVKQFKAIDVANSEKDQFTASIIPEQEAVWQGGLEIHRNGKLHDFCGGFQAHLSSSASDKVLEVARKLPLKIVFNEVSRHCVWPFRFKEAGAREDSIALYFFAKDLDSYRRTYKILLEYMMKHDVALRGNINGIELLIFPSNHLAHRSQRWNTLFFLWGVFRGRRACCLDDRSPPERAEVALSVSNMIPRIDNSSSACLSKNTSLQRPAVEDSSLSGSDTVVSRCEASVADGFSQQKSGPLVNGNCYNEVSNVGGACLMSSTSQVNLEKRSENDSSVLIAEACSESESAVVDHQSQSDLKVVQHQCLSQDGNSGNNLHFESKKPLWNDLLDNTESNNANEKSDKSLKEEDQCVDNSKKNGGKILFSNNVDPILENKDSLWKNDEVESKGENRLKQEGFVDINVSAESSMDDLYSSKYSPKIHPDDDSVRLAAEATSVITSHKRPWMDLKNISEGNDHTSDSKRIKVTNDFYVCEIESVPSSFSDRLDTQIHDVSTSSHIDDISNEALDEKLKYLKPGSAERSFFLVDSHAALSIQSEGSSSPWKVSPLRNENRLPDGSPNLELALGVEKKQTRKGGVLPFFAGIVDKDLNGPPDIASPKEKHEDSSASLSLSLAFPFSDKNSPARSERPLMTTERREVNTSLLFFKGSSGK